MKKILTVLTICIATAIQPTMAQDIHFSQFYENAILRNPALTGIFTGDYKVGVNYRTQWSNIAVPFQTVLASAETRVLVNKEVGDYLSFGFTATYDKAGSISFNTMQIYPAVNFNKSLEDKHHSYLSVGFTAGYIQRSIDMSKATFSSQFVNGGYSADNISGENLNNNTLQNYDLGAGVSLNSSAGENNNLNYYLGIAAYHIAKPKHSFDGSDYLARLNTRWSGNAGMKWTIQKTYVITAHGNLDMQQPYQEIIYGGTIGWQNAAYIVSGKNTKFFALHAGCFARHGDALIPTVRIDYTQYSVLFSYDMNNSSLNQASRGTSGYEVSLYLRGKYRGDKKRTYNYACPRFGDIYSISAPQ